MKWLLVSVVLVCLSAPTTSRSLNSDNDQKYDKTDGSLITDSEVSTSKESDIIKESPINGDEASSNDRSTPPPPKKKKVSSKLLEVLERLKTYNCIHACALNDTAKLNPVCGSGGITFNNMGVFECTRNCGVDIEVRNNGPCPPSPE